MENLDTHERIDPEGRLADETVYFRGHGRDQPFSLGLEEHTEQSGSSDFQSTCHVTAGPFIYGQKVGLLLESKHDRLALAPVQFLEEALHAFR